MPGAETSIDAASRAIDLPALYVSSDEKMGATWAPKGRVIVLETD